MQQQQGFFDLLPLFPCLLVLFLPKIGDEAVVSLGEIFSSVP